MALTAALDDLLLREAPTAAGSKIEQRFGAHAAEIFAGSGAVEVSANELLHGFEADLVLRGAGWTVNVELDGPTHQRPTKRRFCGLRDEHLRRRGVRVLRWPVAECGRWSPGRIRDEFLRCLPADAAGHQ